MEEVLVLAGAFEGRWKDSLSRDPCRRAHHRQGTCWEVAERKQGGQVGAQVSSNRGSEPHGREQLLQALRVVKCRLGLWPAGVGR